jgi:predicted dehydrogenase
MIVEFEGGAMLSAHFDLVDHTHEQSARLVTANSTLKWSSSDPALQIYHRERKEWERISQPAGYDGETSYHDEIGHFLRCIERGERWPIALETAEEVVRLLIALEVGDRERRSVAVAPEKSKG